MNKDINEVEKAVEEADTTVTSEQPKPKKAKKQRTAGAKRRLQYRAGFTATIVIAAVLVVLLNVIVGAVADRFPVTLDISKNKAFTLSEQSVEIAEQVENDIELIIFTNKDIFENPATGIDELDTTLREFSNALKQYNSHSRGKVTYSFIDPTQEPQKFAAYSKYEVESGDMLFLAGERYKTATIYSNQFIQYLSYYGNYSNDLFECTISSNYSSYSFESKAEKLLASNIYNISSGEEHIVQVLVGHEEDEYVIDGLKSLYQLNGYTFEELTITGSKEFNKDANIMLIPAPEKDYSADEIKRVQEWVYNSGNYGRQLMVFINPTADCPNLYEFLEVEYQITVTDELILETDYDRIPNISLMYGSNPLFLLTDIPSTEYTTSAVGTANVYTPLVRRLTTTLPAVLENDTIGSYAVPLTQYPESAKLTKLENQEGANSSEEITYAAPEAEYPLTGMIVHAIDSYNNETQTAVDGRVLVSGCSQLAHSSNIQNNNLQNEELLLDALNTMTGVENAINISSKIIETEYVSFTNAMVWIVGLGIFTIGLPIAVLIVCLVVFVRRKNL